MRSGQRVFCSPTAKHLINVLVQPLHQPTKKSILPVKYYLGKIYLAVTRTATRRLVQYFSYNYKWQNSSYSLTCLSN